MRVYLSILLLMATAAVLTQVTGAQQSAAPASTSSSAAAEAALPDAPSADQSPLPRQDRPEGPKDKNLEGKQTHRILGILPNFLSVSVDEKLPPISKHDKFKLMLNDNFDYSHFIYVGILSGVAQIQNSYPEFHHGAAAYARYYWHGFADTTDGYLMTGFVLPVATREDPRYYTLGRGGFIKRSGYSVSRLLITRSDHGGMAPNISEIVGNGAASGISDLYYPSRERTWTKTGQRWLTQVALDGFSNLVKEFWPDVNSKLLHHSN